MSATLDLGGSHGRTLDRPTFWDNFDMQYSLDDVPEFDPDADITSPRSLEACDIEGVLPEELVYTPFQEFDLPGVDPTVVRMRHDFHEARRQDLLAVVRHRRQEIMLEAGDSTLKLPTPKAGPTLLGSPSGSIGSKSLTTPKKMGKSGAVDRPMSPGMIPPGEHNPMAAYTAPGSPASIAPFLNTYDFFNFWNQELNPHKEMPRDSGESSQSGTPLSPSASLASPSMASVGGMSRMSAGVEDGGSEEGRKLQRSMTPSGGKGVGPTAIEADEAHFLNQLQLMRTCSGSDRVEYDFAKNTENHLVVLRADAEKARAASQQNDRKIVKSRNAMQDHCFDRLLTDTLNNKASREHREVVQRAGCHLRDHPRNYQAQARHQLVFENQVNQMKNLVKKRSDYLDNQTNIQHSRTEKLAANTIQKKMTFAQRTMEERLRWRENHHENVTLKTEFYEAEKLRMFKEREENFQKRQAISDNRSGLRKELYHMRQINRKMNDQLRARKTMFANRKKKDELEVWKEGINQKALSLMPEKMKSNLESSKTCISLSPASLQKSMSSPSLAMSRPVPSHMGSPMSSSLRSGSTTRLYGSWYRHG